MIYVDRHSLQMYKSHVHSFIVVCLQFSCASPSHSCPDSGCEVWVCNSDGYVGQVRIYEPISRGDHFIPHAFWGRKIDL